MIGVYAGTFDPISKGHLDIISRSLSFCDELIIAVGVNSAKKTLFDEDSRKDLIKRSICFEFSSDWHDIRIESFQGLLTEYAKKVKADILIRGIRSVSDFEYEINLANINKVLAPEIETVFIPTSPSLAVVSSSAAKEIAKYGGDVSKFVAKPVAEALYESFKVNH